MNAENLEKKIESMIFILRGQKVMLDSDLANLYRVETKRLNEQVKRNIERFPEDFLITPDSRELEDLRSQIATTNRLTTWNHKRRSTPYLFTENGVAMLSSVLGSEEAIKVNITIMRLFTRLRSFLVMEEENSKLTRLERETNQVFQIVFSKIDELDLKVEQYKKLLEPSNPAKRKKIGIKSKK